jgi:multidrug transporter EmrE-like cation transporter
LALAAYAAVYTTLVTAGLVLLRRSLGGSDLSSAIGDPEFVAGGFAYAASFATFLLALRRFELLTVFPVFSGLAYAAVTVAAVLVLSESLSAGRLLGILLVAAGVYFLVR